MTSETQLANSCKDLIMTSAEPMTIPRFIDRRINELRQLKSQKDIAAEAGYKNHNMITQLKQGSSKLALDRVPALAKALDVDPTFLFRLAMTQYYSAETLTVFDAHLGSAVSENEREILDFVREVSDNSDPLLNEALKSAINAVLSKSTQGKTDSKTQKRRKLTLKK